MTPHRAWRVAYIVPFIIIVAVALGMLLTCEDTPTGRWADRSLNAVTTVEDISTLEYSNNGQNLHQGILSSETMSKEPQYDENKKRLNSDSDTQLESQTEIIPTNGEVIVPPTARTVMHVVFSPPTIALVSQYACSFGAELVLDGILGSYYLENFPHLGQTECGRWAAMFGLLNIVFRPLGGYISDLLYKRTSSLWARKLWLVFLGLVTGAFLLAAGLSNPESEATMFGLFAGLAFFLEAANGANFSLVPHVYPAANGMLLLRKVQVSALT
jgi:NNP family nitrate/nitrite transporter-like MFS transporter